MPTREVQYPRDATGYNALVDDITEMFTWDSIDECEGDPSSSNTPYKTFKKSCGGELYVALRVMSSSRPASIAASGFNGAAEYAQYNSNTLDYVNFAYGDGFFVINYSTSAPPSTSGFFAGVSTCRNILTGETSWCSFVSPVNGSYGSSYAWDYYFYTKDIKGSVLHRAGLVTNAKIGAAVSLHGTDTGFVSDKLLQLNAIPDTYLSCMTRVIFNGVPYVRLGTLLVPAE